MIASRGIYKREQKQLTFQNLITKNHSFDDGFDYIDVHVKQRIKSRLVIH